MILKRDGHDLLPRGAPLAVRSLSVAYGTEPVLWDVTWSVRERKMTAIVGPNGSGKTTLLNAAIGAVTPMAGEALFWGHPFAAMRDRVAYVPQRESVDWDFPVSAIEVVEMGAARRSDWFVPSWLRALSGGRRSDGGTRMRAAEALDRVGMAEFADRPIGQLSGGQQQRVFLARALAQRADLYLLDEPFAGVDVATEAVIADELRRLCEEGGTVVAVHHDLDSVAQRFDDALLLDGRVVASGRVADVLVPENLERAYSDASTATAAV